MLGQEVRHQPLGHGPPMLVQIFTSMPLRYLSYHLGLRGQLLPSPRPQKLDMCLVVSLLLSTPMGKAGNKTEDGLRTTDPWPCPSFFFPEYSQFSEKTLKCFQ